MPKDPIKVYDARWEVGQFDDDAVARLFAATCMYGRELGVDTLTLARDARIGAGRVLDIAVETALRLGFRVICCPDPVSTPQSYYLTLLTTQKHPNAMGLTITASHNPARYIGVKFVVPTVQAVGLDCGPQGGLTRIREIYHGPDRPAPRPGGSLTLCNLRDRYIEESMRLAGVQPGQLQGLAAVIDAFHGSAGPELHDALQRAGVTVHARRLIPDGQFPTGSPNPTSHGKMDDAVRLAGQVRAHAVIGTDGDGDRLVFGDARGILTAGFVTVPILRAAGLTGPRPQPVPVLYDPKVNPLALLEWSRLGAQPILFRNGHSQIKDYMHRLQAIAAAEESGHYYHQIHAGPLTVYCENELLTSLLFLASLHRNPQLMDELWALQDTVRTTGEFNYEFPDDTLRDQALHAVIERLRADRAETTTHTPDGIDLEGTVLSQGVHLQGQDTELAPDWYSGYLRVATNERGVVRSYFSAGRADVLARIEQMARKILADEFGGRVID